LAQAKSVNNTAQDHYPKAVMGGNSNPGPSDPESGITARPPSHAHNANVVLIITKETTKELMLVVMQISAEK